MKKLPVVQQRALSSIRNVRTQMHQDFREDMARKDIEPICRRGCSHCCHHPVHISLLEGILLYNWLEANNLWTPRLKASLKVHANLTTGLPADIWLLTDVPCPLLKENECQAYPARPFVCRTTYSTMNPDMCRPGWFGPDTPMVGRLADLKVFQMEESKLLKAQGVSYQAMPISLALILGAMVAQGELNLEDSSFEVFKQYLEAASHEG